MALLSRSEMRNKSGQEAQRSRVGQKEESA